MIGLIKNEIVMLFNEIVMSFCYLSQFNKHDKRCVTNKVI